MKSLERYPGNKNHEGLYHKIINLIPPHTYYYELFAGSAVIARQIAPGDRIIILNDLDFEVFRLLSEMYPDYLVFNKTAIDFIKEVIAEGIAEQNESFFYLDPPYLHATRPHQTNLYNHEMTDDDHVQLLTAVQHLKSNVMIHHPKCDLYDTMLAQWYRSDLKVRYHRKTQTETLYMNYPPPNELQDYRFLGKDCWDRQRISRKVKQYLQKFQKLPVLERNYILNELNQIKNGTEKNTIKIDQKENG